MKYILLLLVGLFAGTASGTSPLSQRDSLLRLIHQTPADSQLLAYAYWGPRLITFDPAYLPELAVEIRQAKKSPAYEGLALHLEGLFMRHQGSIDSAILLHKAGLAQYQKEKLPEVMLAAAYNYISIAYYFIGAYETHLRYSDTALFHFKSAGDEGMLQVIENNRASTLFLLKKYEEAKQTMLGLLKKVGAENPGLMSSVTQNLSMTYDALNQHDSAAYFAARTVLYAEQSGELRTRLSARQHRLRFLLTDSIELLPAELEAVYALAGELKNRVKKAEIDLFAAEYYRKTGEITRAKSAAKSAEAVGATGGFFYLRQGAVQQLSEIYAAEGKYDSALFYHKKFAAMQDSVLNAEVTRQLQELQVLHNLREKEQQITILRQDSLLSRQRLWFFSILAVVLLLTAAVTLWLMRQRHKARQRLINDEKRIMALEIDGQRLKQQVMEEALERKTKQLLSEAMHLSERNELLIELLEMSDKLPQDRPDAALKTLLDLRKKIRANLDTDRQWEVFSAYFTDINQQFFDAIAATGVSLTDKELRLLALIKTGLSLKECASILHIAPASIKTSRYRLKQKLGLEDEVNLDDFVRNLPN